MKSVGHKKKGLRNAPPRLKKKHEEDELKKKVVLKCASFDKLQGKLKIIKEILHITRMAGKGKAIAKTPSTRTRGSTSRQQPLFEFEQYETLNHAERAKALEERKVIHERTIKFPEDVQDTFREQILARGWGFMYESAITINVSWVCEF
ncbi:hypothetical protein PIB30_086614 [Stylosanthes scabra]|uniref:Uncharacterized protein n=1 Tax=Stylosanthes scabra TaxID=79078 RepID=A0ABU6RU44_9FABA|nr:hypothetical protein [Stylosanthes scabra]